MSTDLDTFQQPDTAIDPVTGELVDLTIPDHAMAFSKACGQLWGSVRMAKERADAAIRGFMRADAATRLQGDAYEAELGVGKADYDAAAMHDELMQLAEDPEHPLTVAAVEGLFVIERTVRDGRELNKIASRWADVGLIVVKHTSRGNGRITVKQLRSQAPAPPRAPEVVQQAAREHTAETRAARSRGI
jgi:hypothetical protein